MDYSMNNQYLEKVYSGVLGKIIGVYLGRPFEGWEHDQMLHSAYPQQFSVLILISLC
mgnify:CR=1 FL=1